MIQPRSTPTLTSYPLGAVTPAIVAIGHRSGNERLRSARRCIRPTLPHAWTSLHVEVVGHPQYFLIRRCDPRARLARRTFNRSKSGMSGVSRGLRGGVPQGSDQRHHESGEPKAGSRADRRATKPLYKAHVTMGSTQQLNVGHLDPCSWVLSDVLRCMHTDCAYPNQSAAYEPQRRADARRCRTCRAATRAGHRNRGGRVRQ